MRLRRSREGAWIEILKPVGDYFYINSRSREGAWIEIWVVFFVVCM